MGYELLFSEVVQYLPYLLEGLKLSILLSLVGMVFGSLLGIICATIRSSHIKVVNKIVSIYIELFRNTPLLVQMYMFYFGLGQFGIQLSPMTCAILALVLNNGAYTSVIFESGITAIETGQKESANALGMTTLQTYLHIIFPQALRLVVPPLTNQFISVFLFSSVASTLSVPELLSRTLYIDSMTMRTFEIFIFATVLYLIVTTIITISSSTYEKSFKY